MGTAGCVKSRCPFLRRAETETQAAIWAGGYSGHCEMSDYLIRYFQAGRYSSNLTQTAAAVTWREAYPVRVCLPHR